MQWRCQHQPGANSIMSCDNHNLLFSDLQCTSLEALGTCVTVHMAYLTACCSSHCAMSVPYMQLQLSASWRMYLPLLLPLVGRPAALSSLLTALRVRGILSMTSSCTAQQCRSDTRHVRTSAPQSTNHNTMAACKTHTSYTKRHQTIDAVCSFHPMYQCDSLGRCTTSTHSTLHDDHAQHIAGMLLVRT